MAKFIPDVKTRRWVVIAPRRALRPDEWGETAQEGTGEIVLSEDGLFEKDGFKIKPGCPFCLGNEDKTPPEVYRWGRNFPNDPNWVVRVVPNKFPITDIHEVVIHSPDHVKDIDQLPAEHVEILFKVYRERYNALFTHGHVLIFNNKGRESGESLTHPHSQIAVIPRQITLDVLPLEPVTNKVFENDQFFVYCPDFSQWPYEVWIASKKVFLENPKMHFGQIGDEEIKDLVKVLKKVLKRLYQLFPNLSYNFYIYPNDGWYLRLMPRNIQIRAGLELGTGLQVNIVDPAKAAAHLRGEPK